MQHNGEKSSKKYRLKLNNIICATSAKKSDKSQPKEVEAHNNKWLRVKVLYKVLLDQPFINQNSIVYC